MLSRLASQQHGIVSRTQLLDAGVSRRAIGHRLDVGTLHPLYLGVYAVGHAAITEHGRLMAAVLASGPGAAASHRTAAVEWEFLRPAPGPIQITRTGPRRDGREGIELHHARDLQTTLRHGIPITTPVRTLVDLAGTATTKELARAVEQARLNKLVSEATLLTAAAGRPGADRLRELLEHEPKFTRSKAERRLLALVARANLPTPRTNVYIGPHEVDALWPQQRLAVEVDSWTFHAHREAFERDRLRDADLQAAGYRVLRITWRQLTRRPEALAARLATALAGSA